MAGASLRVKNVDIVRDKMREKVDDVFDDSLRRQSAEVVREVLGSLLLSKPREWV